MAYHVRHVHFEWLFGILCTGISTRSGLFTLYFHERLRQSGLGLCVPYPNVHDTWCIYPLASQLYAVQLSLRNAFHSNHTNEQLRIIFTMQIYFPVFTHDQSGAKS